MTARILIVDDSASDRLIIKNMLGEYNIITAKDGLEAMSIINDNLDIDLMILDLNMPNMNGFEVLEALNSDSKYNKLRTIILTNYDEMENEIRGLRLGAVDYISKPIRMESLKARIDIHIELLQIQNFLEKKVDTQSFTYDTIFYQAPIGIAILKNNEPFIPDSNDLVTINPKFEEIIGRTKKEALNTGLLEMTHPDDIKEVLTRYKKVIDNESDSLVMDSRFVRPNGSIVWVHMVLASLNHSKENDHKYILLVQDISNRKEMEENLHESERSKSVLLSHLPGLAYRCNFDKDWTMKYVSNGCFDLTGYPAESLLLNQEISFSNIIAPEYHNLLWMEWEKVLASRTGFNYEYQIITANGQRKWVLELGQGIFDDSGKVEALEGIILDITDRKTIEDKLRYNNEHDLLTGLLNGNYLKDLLEIDSSLDTKRALIGINLSDMDSLTAAFGFQYTLELKKKIAKALSMLSTENIILFNTFEIQFVFYFKDYNEKSQIDLFCKDIADILETLLTIERVGGGIGVIEINEYMDLGMNQLLRNVLIASVKAIDIFDRDFGVKYFDYVMGEEVIREENIKKELNYIVSDDNDGGLYLQYQPVIDVKTNSIYGFEALARMNSEKLGKVPPLDFIPIAEKTKLIVPVGEKIIIQAFRFLKKLEQAECNKVNVSINISAIQLLRQGFVDRFLDLVNEIGINPMNIGLEITESIFASDYDEINRILGVFKSLGVKIAIDDFGTGYSSLSRERELNINCLKIDKQFIDKLTFLKREEAITADIISLAHKLGHYVVAEGVEVEVQRRYLEEHGCDFIQGYLISRPLDEEVAMELILKQLKEK